MLPIKHSYKSTFFTKGTKQLDEVMARANKLPVNWQKYQLNKDEEDKKLTEDVLLMKRTEIEANGVAFCVCRVEEHLLLAETLCGDNARDMEAALREGARLVKDDGVRIGKRLEIVAALDEDAGTAH